MEQKHTSHEGEGLYLYLSYVMIMLEVCASCTFLYHGPTTIRFLVDSIVVFGPHLLQCVSVDNSLLSLHKLLQK